MIELVSTRAENGTIKIDDAISKSVNSGTKLAFICDDNLISMPQYLKAQEKAGIKPIIGANIKVSSGGVAGRLIFIPKNEKGISELSKAIELIESNSSDGNKATEIDDLPLMDNNFCIITANSLYVDIERSRDRTLTSNLVASLNKKTKSGLLYGHYDGVEELEGYNNFIKSGVRKNRCISISETRYKRGERAILAGKMKHVDKLELSEILKMVPSWQVDKELPKDSLFTKNTSRLHSLIGDYGVLRDESVADIDFGIDLFPETEVMLDNYLKENPELDREKYENVLRNEISVINKTGFKNYFNLVVSFVRYCRDNNVDVRVRGSAGSSLLLYLNGASDELLDPVYHNLDFRRFLGEHRANAPDIDIELPTEDIPKFSDFLSNFIDKKQVTRVLTERKFSKISSALDVARTVINEVIKKDSSEGEITKELLSKIKKEIDRDLGFNTCRDKTISEIVSESGKLRELCRKDPKVNSLISIVQVMEGWTHSYSNHATAMIVNNDSISKFSTVKKGGEYIALTTSDNLELIGEIKYDIISSRINGLIKKAEVLIENGGGKVVVDPKDDSAVVFLSENCENINQLSSELVGKRRRGFSQQILKKVNPQNFNELVAVFALIRPAVGEKEVQRFIDGRGGKAEYSNWGNDETIKSIFERTNGTFIFDEQILQIATQFSDLPLDKADKLRTAIRKDKVELFHTLKDDFISGAISKGVSSDVSNKVWSNLENHIGKYLYNETHAMVYALTALKQAVIKRDYPASFYQTHVINDKEKNKDVILGEMRREGVKLMSPNINISEANQYKDLSSRRFKSVVPPLSTSVNDSALIDLVIQERNENGSFFGLKDFLDRLTQKYTNSTPHTNNYNESSLSKFRDSVQNMIVMGVFDIVGFDINNTMQELGFVEKKEHLLTILDIYLDNYTSTTPIVELKSKEMTVDYEINKSELLEKIINSLGYEPDEVVSLSSKLNLIKSDNLKEENPAQIEKISRVSNFSYK